LPNAARCGFKDSYGPPPGGNWRAPPRRWSARGGQGDVVVADEQLDLQMQLKEAQAEVAQLRSAVRVSANALHQASMLLPPEHRRDVEAQEGLLNELVEEIKRKDAEILRLSRVEAEHANAGARYRRSVQRAMEQWAPRGEVRLLKEMWEAWHDLQRNSHWAKRSKEVEQRLQAGIQKFSRRWAFFLVDASAKNVLSAWHSFLRIQKQEKLKLAREQEKIDLFRKCMMGESRRTALSVCFSAWQRICDEAKRHKHLEAQRMEQQQANKELKAKCMARAIMGMGKQSEQQVAVETRILLRAWAQQVRDAKASKASEAEKARAKQVMVEAKEQAKRKALLLMKGAGRETLKALFDTWKLMWKVKQRENLDTKQFVWFAWRAQVREMLVYRRAEQERKKFEEERQKAKLSRQAAMGLVGNKDASMLMGIVMSTWREFRLEALKERQAQEERQRWEQEAKERDAKTREDQRRRSVMMAVSLVDKDSAASQELLLRTGWNAWQEQVNRARFEKSLQGHRLTFEAEREAELALREERNRKAEEQRQAMVMMMFADRESVNNRMWLQIVWSAWRDEVMENKSSQVQKLLLQQEVRRSSEQADDSDAPTLAPSEGSSAAERALKSTRRSQRLLCCLGASARRSQRAKVRAAPTVPPRTSWGEQAEAMPLAEAVEKVMAGAPLQHETPRGGPRQSNSFRWWGTPSRAQDKKHRKK